MTAHRSGRSSRGYSCCLVRGDCRACRPAQVPALMKYRTTTVPRTPEPSAGSENTTEVLGSNMDGAVKLEVMGGKLAAGTSNCSLTVVSSLRVALTAAAGAALAEMVILVTTMRLP